MSSFSLWYVLWFWSAVGWGFHGVTLTPGWVAWTAAPTRAECIEQVRAMPIRPDIHAIMCLPSGLSPRGRIATEARPWRPY